MSDAVFHEVKFSGRVCFIDLCLKIKISFYLICLVAGSVITTYLAVIKTKTKSVPVTFGVSEKNTNRRMRVFEMSTGINIANVIGRSSKKTQLPLCKGAFSYLSKSRNRKETEKI